MKQARTNWWRVAAMIVLFLMAACATCLIVIVCFLSQTDLPVSRISRSHAGYLYTFIIASWSGPWLLLITFREPTEEAVRYLIILVQFVLLAAIYVIYRLPGVLALHISGIVMYLIFVAICIVDSVAVFGEMPWISPDSAFVFAMAMLCGSLTSALYALVYIAIRRRAARSGGTT